MSMTVYCCVECGSWFPGRPKVCGMGHKTRRMKYEDFQAAVEHGVQRTGDESPAEITAEDEAPFFQEEHAIASR